MPLTQVLTEWLWIQDPEWEYEQRDCGSRVQGVGAPAAVVVLGPQCGHSQEEPQSWGPANSRHRLAHSDSGSGN